MRRGSPSSAGATYLNRLERVEALRQVAARAANALHEIRSVVLFGSLASGVPTPRSDADLLVEVTSSRFAEPRDRLPEVLRALSPLPCPVDLFVLTTAEIESGRAQRLAFLGMIERTGIMLFQRGK